MNYVILALALVVSACAPPLAPSPIEITPVVLIPAAITLTGGTATGSDAVLLNVRVTDPTGKGVPGQLVTLTTTAGTLTQANVTTGGTGTAQAELTTTQDATVTATLGPLSVTARALAHPIFVAPEPPPPPPPVVIPPPPATCSNTPSLCPPPPPPVLTASLTCTPLAHGTPSPCNVSVSYGGTLLPATTIAAVVWNWGDGQTDATAIPVTTHSYASAGTYPVFVTVTATTSDGAKTATVFRSLLIP